MVDLDVEMSYFDRVRYIQTAFPVTCPRLLDVVWERKTYSLNIIHAALEELRIRGKSPHSHDLYHIVLYTRGHDRLCIKNRIVPVKAEDLAISSPGEPHDFGPVDGSQVSYREVTFELTAGSERLNIPFRSLLAHHLGRTLPEVEFPVSLSRSASVPLHDLFRTLLERLCGKTPFDDLAAHATLAEIFTRIAVSVYGRDELFNANLSPVEQARKLIDRQATTWMRLEDLAQQVHLSPAHLCRQFKARFGRSPIAYHQEQRMLAAQRLLTTTTLSCKEIATNLGFSDVYTFSKAFKRVTGTSPSQYKREQAAS
jgi:AraC-like DNA-binding protein